MPCYKPLTGYRSKFLSKNGKRPIVFSTATGYIDMTVTVPCGRCTGCRLDYSRQWAIRCMHESQLHEQNSFITLTYNNENLPADKSINKEEMQKFFKRLRKKYGKDSVRYFACGEYGDQSGRAHYHAIIFGKDFSEDRYIHTKTKTGDLLYRSPSLEKIWTKGHSLIGDVTFQSCAYVARYVMKKRKGKDDEIDPKTGKTNKQYYEALDDNTGAIIELTPEFCLMSRRPGIAKDWWEQFKSDTDKDFITHNGNKMSLPKYYDYLLEKEDPEKLKKIKLKRKARAEENPEENTLIRLQVKETCKIAQLNQLNRKEI